MTGSPFAKFERRAAGVIIDFLTMFFLTFAIQISIIDRLGLNITDGRPVFFAVAVVYFAVSWASPLSATPVQWLLGIRIVNKSGDRLDLSRAALRAMVLIGAIMAAMTLFNVPENPKYLAVAIPTLALLFLAALTTNRQSVHDFVAGSLVVTKDAVKTLESRSELREYVADYDSASRAKKRPKPLTIVVAAIVMLIPLFGMYNVALMNFDRELRYRLEYAYRETADLRAALYGVHLQLGYWATTKNELGVETRVDYPDGGYYELEEGGVIRIRFTVIPKLKKISLLIRPTWKEDELVWECRVQGEISRGILPAHCRD
jgi:uncharacterized RDD family membrane protein YckC